jgi:hypothetical protein
MKMLISALMLMSSMSAFATHDSLIKVTFARVAINDDATACKATTLAWDGISTNMGSALSLAMTAITNPQKVYGIQVGSPMIDINFLTQSKAKYSVNVEEDWDNYGNVSIDLSLKNASADEANILYYLAVKNAFDLGAKKVFMQVQGVNSLTSSLLFPVKTTWPLTKTSPVFKTLESELSKRKIFTDC